MGTRAQILVADASVPEIMSAWEEARHEGDLRHETLRHEPLLDLEVCELLPRPFVCVHVPFDLAGNTDCLSSEERYVLKNGAYSPGCGLGQLWLSRVLTASGGEAALLAASDMSSMSMSARVVAGSLEQFEFVVQQAHVGYKGHGWRCCRWGRGEVVRDDPKPDGVSYRDPVDRGTRRVIERFGGDSEEYDFDGLLDLIEGLKP